jgi:hypothetical protein
MIDWQTIERLVGGKYGRVMTTCPLCSDGRRNAQSRRRKVLAINRIEPEFAVFYCNHCQASGHSRPDGPGRVIDLAERRRQRQSAERLIAADKKERTGRALKLWDEAQTFRGSPAESYLRNTRCIGEWLDHFDLDETLRFHPQCPFDGQRLPCMIALVRDIRTDTAVAIHRTALTTDDPPKRISRMSLGPTGGGAIKLSPNDEVSTSIMIAEGIETALAASLKFHYRPVWSVLDKNGIAKFPALSGIECAVIAVDNDADGGAARAADECVNRLTHAGIECFTAKPSRVKDFNDIILGRHHA